MVDLEKLTQSDFKDMPLVIEGESKEVRYAGNGEVVIKYKPTIYSFTANRPGIIEGSERLRLRATRVFLEVLREAGIPHAYKEVTDQWVLSELVLQPRTKHNKKPFRPKDIGWRQKKKLSIAPNIETIVKRMHSGTSKHRYHHMDGYPVRKSHPLYGGFTFDADQPYPCEEVRFDWRNPLVDEKGNRLADESVHHMANLFIDTQEAEKTALLTYSALSEFLADRDITIYDLCLFITEDGKKVFGEISQDCGRFRHFDLGSLDKDVWRAGGSEGDVLAKWQTLLDFIEH